MEHSILIFDNHDAVFNLMNENLDARLFLTETIGQALDNHLKASNSLAIVNLSAVNEMDPIALIEIMSKISQTPILVISKNKNSIINALNKGAAHCMKAPYDPELLVAKVIAMLRCDSAEISNSKTEPLLETKTGITVDPGARKVYSDDQTISLTKKEYEILLLLVNNRGLVLSYEKIYNLVWNDSFMNDDKKLIFHVRNLREKLGDNGNLIENIRGYGYRFNDK